MSSIAFVKIKEYLNRLFRKSRNTESCQKIQTEQQQDIEDTEIVAEGFMRVPDYILNINRQKFH